MLQDAVGMLIYHGTCCMVLWGCLFIMSLFARCCGDVYSSWQLLQGDVGMFISPATFLIEHVGHLLLYAFKCIVRVAIVSRFVLGKESIGETTPSQLRKRKSKQKVRIDFIY